MKKKLTIVFVSFLWIASLHSQSTNVELLQRKAWQGDAIAQYNLGVMYVNSGGSGDSNSLAYLWLSLAAAQGSEEARKQGVYSNSSLVNQIAANALTIRNIAASRMTPQQIAQAQELARNWKPKK